MKSISDWRKEKKLDSEINETLGNINLAATKNVFGNASGKVDPELRSSLRSKILQIAKEHPELHPLNLFREIMKVVGMLIWRMGGSNFSNSRFTSTANQGQNDQNEWAIIKTIVENDLDQALQLRATGPKLETDQKIKAALKIAYDHIKKYPEYKEISDQELFDKMRDALLLLSADMKSNTGSTRSALDRISSPDDPIAKETIG